MCRLYGVCAAAPVRVNRAFAALRSLSHEHKDGWGVVRFDGASPEVVTGLGPAHSEARFAELGASLTTRSMLVHIRLASVGAVVQENTHPFIEEGWAFTHNGTIRRFKERKAAFEALIPPARLARIRGETDSERCFQLFLHHLEGPSLPQVARALATVMAAVERTFDLGETELSATNFLVGNGRVMAACRRGRGLFTAERAGVRMIASEPLWHDDPWEEVPEGGVVGVDESLTFTRFDP